MDYGYVVIFDTMIYDIKKVKEIREITDVDGYEGEYGDLRGIVVDYYGVMDGEYVVLDFGDVIRVLEICCVRVKGVWGDVVEERRFGNVGRAKAWILDECRRCWGVEVEEGDVEGMMGRDGFRERFRAELI